VKLTAQKMSFILTFDIPRELTSERKRVNLSLRKINAKTLQFSVWKHENLSDLMKVAIMIKSVGGSARILEEKFIF
jgi:uncharacterized protein (UPF0128 family)